MSSAGSLAHGGATPSTLRIDGIPPELARHDQWVIWKHQAVAGQAKTTKVPFSVRGGHASTTDPSTWGSFDAALTSLTTPGNSHDGIGFVVTSQDEWVGVDIDHCLAGDGTPEPWAAEIVRRLDSRTERTPSGDGLRVWVRGKWPAQRHKVAEGRGAIEVYDHSRYFTVTGNRLEGTRTAIEQRQEALDWLAERFFAPKAPTEPRATVVPSAPLPGDYETLRRARAAKNGDRFSALFDRGDLTAHDNDHSKADVALCSQLAFWTGADATRIDGLFRQSALMREKWNERRGTTTYGEMTIEAALARVTETYTPRAAAGSLAPLCANSAPVPDVDAWEDGRDARDPERSGSVSPPRQYTLLRVADVVPRRPTFLWRGAGIAFGKLSILEGDPGLGKSTILFDLAARVTTGAPMPFETDRREPAGVVILSDEDDPEDTIRPRLEAAGADLTRVFLLTATRDDAGRIQDVTLPRDTDRLGQAAREVGAQLVIVDPPAAYFGREVDSFKDADVRRGIRPLQEMVRSLGAVLLFNRHLNKGTGKAMYKGGGSIAFVAAARAVLQAHEDPEVEGRRVLAAVKCNLTRLPKSMTYRLVNSVASDPDSPTVVDWEGSTDRTADDLLAVEREQSSGRDGATQQAQEFLKKILGQGPVRAVDGYSRAEEAGIPKRTVERAKQRLGVGSDRPGGPGSAWYWYLPGQKETA